jgi:hypothetical protein
MFDFPIALKLIQIELKNRNIPNYELFNVFELRSRWTDIELKQYRKLNNKDKENMNTNESKILKAEKDERIILSTIKESKIDSIIFNSNVDIAKQYSKSDEYKKESKNIGENESNKNEDVKNSKKKDQEKSPSKNQKKEESGVRLLIEEAEINYSELD